MNHVTPKSPYAAPHTPIASSKRLKINPKPRTTPMSSVKTYYTTATPEKSGYTEDQEDELTRKNAHKPHRTIEPYTPSKNLFSPGLRTEGENLKRSHDDFEHDDFPSMSTDSHDSRDNSYPNTPDEEIKQQSVDESLDDDVFNPYLFIAQLPDHELVRKNHIVLPSLSHSSTEGHPMTLVLDLDETLVHCTVEPIPKPDLIFPVEFNGNVYQVYVRKRPYLDYFLETVSKNFEIVLFTASQKVYADVLLDNLDPQKKYINHRLFRESCLLVQGNYLKDLHVLGRDLKKTLLVDNSPHAYAYQLNNGIPIESWYDEESDTELLKLIGFLKGLQNVEDVRPVVKNHFKSHILVSRAKRGLSVPLTAPPF